MKRHEQRLQQEREESELKAELDSKRYEVMLRMKDEIQKKDIQKLERMKEMGVDLTKLLVAQQGVPDKFLKIDTGDGKLQSRVHLNVQEAEIGSL